MRSGIKISLLLLLVFGSVIIVWFHDDRKNAENKSGLEGAEILIIRHAEKPTSGSVLSQAGSARADAYLDYFQHFRCDAKPLHLDYLFAAADSRESCRPRLTLEPLSQALNLPIDTRFKNRQVRDLAHAMRSLPPDKQFLICWHHGEIPALLRAFGADPEKIIPGGKWPNSVFTWLIWLRFDKQGQLMEARCINAAVLPEDANKPPSSGR
jgi:hypothetical protein